MTIFPMDREGKLLMTAARIATSIVLTGMLAAVGCNGGGQTVNLSSAAARKAFLARRAPTGVPAGTFYKFSNFMLASRNVSIATDSARVANEELGPPFPKTYRPTWREVFDAIARQTRSTWRYDGETKGLLFSEPGAPLPYSVQIAKGWTAKEEGSYVSYIPPRRRGGMDVQMLGTYTPDRTIPNFNRWVRNALAFRLARQFSSGVTTAQMKKLPVDGAEALYFECPAKRPHTTWRQWVFVKDGRAFAILSLLADRDEKALLPAVKAMVASFRVRPPKK